MKYRALYIIYFYIFHKIVNNSTFSCWYFLKDVMIEYCSATEESNEGMFVCRLRVRQVQFAPGSTSGHHQPSRKSNYARK